MEKVSNFEKSVKKYIEMRRLGQGHKVKWEVYVSRERDYIDIEVMKGMLALREEGRWSVHPPTPLQRFFGITMEKKYNKTLKKAKKLADKWNKRDGEIDKVISDSGDFEGLYGC